ncbi:hypothetical protein [Limobrevibacterium gyesilva]|uniref:Uncharacterized protein n=1 Tax=Limobrevibacterium gyesilva TaxID=2991712 RepID=A0AA41YYM8_9PROT|nr:hypothetical protein [Limobrevibacterium gyesilva]MCW3477657.1 hypothetical protein [Limobrevibacterium gyesilva]
MADQSDVETMLADLVEGALYPQGTGAPSLPGRVCRIYRGWPNAAALEDDLAAGRVHVTVFPEAGRQRNTTRWPDDFVVTAPVAPVLTIGVRGVTATLGGRADAGQLAGLLVDNLAVVHRTRDGDTPELVAAVLASQVRTRRIALLAGAAVTVPGAGLVVGRVVADQPALRETRRQVQGFRISCWCPDPATRDAVASVVDAALSAQAFIALPDRTGGRLRFVSSVVRDDGQDAALYRRDLVYDVDYATTVSALLASMIFGDVTVAPAGAGVVQSLLG